MSAALSDQFEYQGVETCAGDGSCSLACPVGIDTGAVVKDLRRAQHGRAGERVALALASHWEGTEAVARVVVRAAHAVAGAGGGRVLAAGADLARRAVTKELFPAWLAVTPMAAPGRLPATVQAGAAAVYFPACINRIFGDPPGRHPGLSLSEALVAVSARAGRPLWIPEDAPGHCCATVWHSKGYERANTFKANEIVEALWRWSGGGSLPVVIDASSCTWGVVHEVVPYLTGANAERHAGIEVLDSVAWTRRLLDDLEVARPVERVAVHPTCSLRHLGLTDQLQEVAARLGREVFTPVEATCCGFAGDRGFLHPELADAASAGAARELAGTPCDAFVSSNRTCEIGLHRGTGQPYGSVVLLLEELSR